MVNGLYKFFALIFLLFTGFTSSGRGIIYHINQKNNKEASIRAANPGHNPYNYEYNLDNAPFQGINIQQHRGAHSSQAFYSIPGVYSVGIKYLNFICGTGTSQLSRFRKLILFPFHAFW
jgi:hypothetical protein